MARAMGILTSHMHTKCWELIEHHSSSSQVILTSFHSITHTHDIIYATKKMKLHILTYLLHGAQSFLRS
jgi:CHASE3 domain sensor protein